MDGKTTRASTLDDALAALRRGEAIGLPTETVYGLAADAHDPAAVRRIYELKGRPSDHPLIVHVADAVTASRWAGDWPEAAEALADADQRKEISETQPLPEPSMPEIAPAEDEGVLVAGRLSEGVKLLKKIRRGKDPSPARIEPQMTPEAQQACNSDSNRQAQPSTRAGAFDAAGRGRG